MSGNGEDQEHQKVTGVLDTAALKNFDNSTGNFLERLIFNHRPLFVLLCIAATLVLGFQAMHLHLSSSYRATLPQSSPYIQNYLKYKNEVPTLGNLVRIVVENKSGTIYNADYLKVLHQVYNTVYSVPGVYQSGLKSLWAPNVRYTEVTPRGYMGGPVMPNKYNGSKKSMEELKHRVNAANLVGRLVGRDLKSSMLVVPLLEKNPKTNKPLNYQKFSHRLEQQVRSKVPDNIAVHTVGFAKVQGDLMDGVNRVMGYFAISVLITALIMFLYNRCVRSTLILILSSFIAVLWELGLIKLLGYSLDPYSVLVPFLVFAIGVSHGSQKMNGIMQDIGRGASSYVAARFTFRRLFMAGLTALLADAVGFAVLMVIDIPVIRALALTASLGVAVLIFTNLLLLPVMLSYCGVSRKAAERSLKAEENYGNSAGFNRVWSILQHLTERRWAVVALLCAVVLFGLGMGVSQHLQTGTLSAGASALWPDSQYNRDNAYITSHYGLSSNQFAVLVKTPKNGCSKYSTLIEMDRLGWQLRQIPGVTYTDSLARRMRLTVSGSFEGNPKWQTLIRNPAILNPLSFNLTSNNPALANRNCSLAPLVAYLHDHKAGTLKNVLESVESFAAQHDTDQRKFLPVAGSAGVQAVTNRVVKHASDTMLYYVYAAVILLCLIAFRSWRAVLVAIIPLIITSKLCEALMVMLGIGVKVSTLPVIALGVGIGVDYALYLLSIQLDAQRTGMSLKEGYRLALHFTGKVVALVGITLAAGVITWAWSPIKFQADMGILLTFMFLWNMIGALILIPALSHFLLNNVKPVDNGKSALF